MPLDGYSQQFPLETISRLLVVGGSNVGVASAHSPFAGTYLIASMVKESLEKSFLTQWPETQQTLAGEVRGGSGQYKREWVGGKVQL